MGIGERILDEGSSIGPATLSVGSYLGKGKYNGALMLDIQGDASLGTFYGDLASTAKKLGIPVPPIEKITGSFNYGSSSKTYIFFELSYDDEQDVIETMKKAGASRVQLLVLTPDNLPKSVMDVATELKAKIRKR